MSFRASCLNMRRNSNGETCWPIGVLFNWVSAVVADGREGFVCVAMIMMGGGG